MTRDLSHTMRPFHVCRSPVPYALPSYNAAMSSITASSSPLPIDACLATLRAALAQSRNVVLQAPPGAGKTTRVPLELLQEPWSSGQRIVMLEPRRIAARAAAYYMAAQLNERVGETVGYRVRMESRVGARIEVVTEGVLTRLLQDDPALEGIALVIFDEFHERSLQADLGLALCLETQAALRDDLRLLVMSATLDAAPVAKLLGDAPLVTSEGRAYPVETRYISSETRHVYGPSWAQVAAVVRRALSEEEGSALVFLPGVADIKRVERLLSEAPLPHDVQVTPLYGELTLELQERAIRPAPLGRRKVVLATSIAETSLTIEGVRIIVDSGWARVPRFDPVGGMTRLETVRVSRASAEQRHGRAGRLGPGVCYRLWSEGEQARLAEFNRPEILEADLAPLALELAQWGASDPARLTWLDAPPPAAYAQARDLLRRLGALDARGAITAHGRDMARLPMHPRLAHMLLRGKALGAGALACTLAALLGERDVIKDTREADVRLRLLALRGENAIGTDPAACMRVRKIAAQFRKQLNVDEAETAAHPDAGLLLALAYPDRIGQRRPGNDARYRLANGRGAFFAEHEILSDEPYICAAELDGEAREAREARIFLAAAVNIADIERYFAADIVTRDFVEWDSKSESAQARRQRLLRELILDDAPLPCPNEAAVTAAMVAGIRAMGSDALPWTDGLRAWQQRVLFLRRVLGKDWPDVSDAALLARMEAWFTPYLRHITRRSHLARIDLRAALYALLTWEQQRALEHLAPTHLTVPSGTRVVLDYGYDPPVLAVRLQELFGARDTPRLAGGKVAVLLHLLSPARRPVQVTQDLAGFWARSYYEVKKDLKGRYPKHHWPDDPLQAEPTARTKRRAPGT